MDSQQLSQQLEVINESTASLLKVIDELKELSTSRLENIENELRQSTRTLQQSIVLLTELAASDQKNS